MYRVFVCSVALVVAGALATGCSKNGSSARPAASKSSSPPARVLVTIETSMGAIRAELWGDRAPETVANFLQYADDGHYDGLIFHRVMDGFMIQGGGMDPGMQERTTREPIRNEASETRPNVRGTLAMARTRRVHSATSQFFINLVDNRSLNHRGTAPHEFGYCAFGKVVGGMDVVDRIARVRTTTVGVHGNVPVAPVIIRSIRRQ